MNQKGLVLSRLSLSVNQSQKELQSIGLSISSVEPWKITDKVRIDDVSIYFLVSNPSSSQSDLICKLSGDLQIGSEIQFRVAASLPDYVLSCYMIKGDNVSLTQLIDYFKFDEVSIPEGFPNILFSELGVTVDPKNRSFSLSGAASSDWSIIPDMVVLEEIETNFEVERSAGKTIVSGFILGIAKIAGTEVSFAADIDDQLILQGNISRLSLSAILEDFFDLVDSPTNLPELDLANLEITVTPKTREFLLMGQSSNSWKLSLGSKDLDIQNVSLEVRKKESVKGVIAGTISLSGLGVDKLLKIDSLNIRTELGSKVSDLLLVASLGQSSQITISNEVTFGQIEFSLRPDPQNYTLALQGTMTAKLGDSVLEFIGKMYVSRESAVFGVKMEGSWNDPFGARGVTIADVAIDVGVTIQPFSSDIKIKGKLQARNFEGEQADNFEGEAAVRFAPMPRMLVIKFNQLYLIHIISTFCGTDVRDKIPDNLSKTALNVGFEDVKIYIVPQATTIGTDYYEQGIQLEGTMFVWGARADGYMKIDYFNGIEVKGDVDAIDLAGIFQLTGKGEKPKPSLYLKVSPTSFPRLDISGAVELLGIRSETELHLSDQGFEFETSGKIFDNDKFQCYLKVKGTNLTKGEDFELVAMMQQDLLDYLSQEASAFIKSSADEATQGLSKAQSEVDSAQQKVDKLDTEINDMRQTIQRERDRDSQRMRDAQRKVEDAQNKVNSLQSDIDNANRRIEDIRQEIRNKRSWFDSLPRWLKRIFSKRLKEFENFVSTKQLDILALEGKIASLEGSKILANGVLEGAKQFLDKVKTTIQVFPIDADPRMFGLLGAQKTATGALYAAKQTLEGLKRSMGPIAKVGQYVVKYGVGGLIDVRSASFKGSLGLAKDGKVSLKLSVLLLKKQTQNLTLDFDFYNPISGVQRLADECLDYLDELV